MHQLQAAAGRGLPALPFRTRPISTSRGIRPRADASEANHSRPFRLQLLQPHAVELVAYRGGDRVTDRDPRADSAHVVRGRGAPRLLAGVAHGSCRRDLFVRLCGQPATDSVEGDAREASSQALSLPISPQSLHFAAPCGLPISRRPE